MQLFIIVVTIFFIEKNFGFCWEIYDKNVTSEDLIFSATLENLNSEKEILIPGNANENSSKYFGTDIFRPLPLISEPLIEENVWNASSVKMSNRKRHVRERGFTHESKMMLLELHNLYRSNVTPPAGNMAYMEWDDELAKLAQIWSDECNFVHGMPENNYSDTIGQNLYKGTDPTGHLALHLWFEEQNFYDLQKDYCLPGKQCGHYIQMAWYKSKKLGCGMTKCEHFYHITCHYSPQALKGIPMYRIAKPCSQCPSRKGSLCLKNLCMTWRQCKNNPLHCNFAECNLECLNCGRLDKERCLCECADGWDSPDCSNLCGNKHKMCGQKPRGFPKASCYKYEDVSKIYCRKMCDMCNPVNISISNDTCCGGMLCDDGFVLDQQENTCKCKLLCPGPLCDQDENGKYQAALSGDGDENGKYQAVRSGSYTLYCNLFYAISMVVSILFHKDLQKIF